MVQLCLFRLIFVPARRTSMIPLVQFYVSHESMTYPTDYLQSPITSEYCIAAPDILTVVTKDITQREASTFSAEEAKVSGQTFDGSTGTVRDRSTYHRLYQVQTPHEQT